MYRTWVILRHTFVEAVVQPIYPLLLALGSVIIVVFGLLPFFTLGEDTVMFKSVGLDVLLLLVLISTLFATSKSVFEEIKDRNMLTLMSKPVSRWQVLVGKYLGIVFSALLAVFVLGLVLCLVTWWRIPNDYQISAYSVDDVQLKRLLGYRLMHVSGLIPELVLKWLEISVLAAVGVALSTRVSLVVNLPMVIFLYIAGNLLRFLFPFSSAASPLHDSSKVVKAIAYVGSLLLPYLETFDLRARTIYGTIRLTGTQFARDSSGVFLGQIWGYVGIAALSAIAYATFVLAVGMWSFQSRELGGAEG